MLFTRRSVSFSDQKFYSYFFFDLLSVLRPIQIIMAFDVCIVCYSKQLKQVFVFVRPKDFMLKIVHLRMSGNHGSLSPSLMHSLPSNFAAFLSFSRLRIGTKQGWGINSDASKTNKIGSITQCRWDTTLWQHWPLDIGVMHISGDGKKTSCQSRSVT